MKKNLIRLLAAAMGAACVLSFAACGGNNASKTESGASSKAVSFAASQADASSPASSAAAPQDISSAPASSAADDQVSSAAATDGFETVEDFINSDIMQEQLNSMKESMASSGMDVDITANGNQLIYTFIYQDTKGVDPETLGSVLGTLTDSMAETFEGIASDLAEAVGADASVVVTYVAEDGSELYSQEFFPAAE